MSDRDPNYHQQAPRERDAAKSVPLYINEGLWREYVLVCDARTPPAYAVDLVSKYMREAIDAHYKATR